LNQFSLYSKVTINKYLLSSFNTSGTLFVPFVVYALVFFQYLVIHSQWPSIKT